tara:strand:+ start:7080 stop:7730 length:651 start_codon:yes stop_codon:yes gene_type:complete
MIIHQIFLKVSDKNLEDFPKFIKSRDIWIKLCEKNNWEYKLWTDYPMDIFTDDDKKYFNLLNDRHPFCKLDYLRYIILSHYGGMYVDLDVIPTEKFMEIYDKEIITGRTITKTSKNPKTPIRYHHNGNLIKFPKHIANEIRLYTHTEIKRLTSMKIYDTWKIRFYFHSVGPNFFHRFCERIKKIKVFEEFDTYFTDLDAQSWNNNEVNKLIPTPTQ